jgi:hypothetical protein
MPRRFLAEGREIRGADWLAGPLPSGFPVRDVSVRDQLPRPRRPDQTSDQRGQPTSY